MTGRHAEYFNTYFKPLHDQYGWVVVNAWISATETTQDLWDQNAELEKEGWVDHQAHGVVHNIPIGPYSTRRLHQRRAVRLDHGHASSISTKPQ